MSVGGQRLRIGNHRGEPRAFARSPALPSVRCKRVGLTAARPESPPWSVVGYLVVSRRCERWLSWGVVRRRHHGERARERVSE